ncbi:ATP-binding protein [Litorivivens sp.]|uniref:sensor histidine kinase n=1 Tax=Litorivivens sp. TaxID=2020868 RepID=UPI0035683C9C
MNRLFLRIFIAFWLTTLITLVAGQQLSHLLQREGPRVNQVREQHEAARQFLHRAARRYRWDDPVEWLRWLDRKDQPFDWMLRRLDGADLSHGLSWSPELETKINSRPLRNFRKPIPLNDGVLIIRPLVSKNGLDGYLVAKVKHPHPLVVEWLYEHLWLRLLLALLATGAVSYWMVRRYTLPIRQLREATQVLAGGDLSLRLSDTEGKDDLSALRRDFNEMAARLDEARQRQRSLIHDISHELRTPLARIQAALALAERREGSAEELSHIRRECDALNALIAQLLDEPAQSEALNDTIALQPFLQRLVEQNQLEAESRQLKLRLVDNAPREIWLQVAAGALHSAIENVLRNAIRHSPKGETIEIVSGELSNGDLQLEIRDRGPGVPEEALDKLFQPFFRLDDSRSRNSGGFGLGLAICRRIVESHGGRVSAHNCKPGLAVKLRLPATLKVTPPSE